jgi:hypothetical protein
MKETKQYEIPNPIVDSKEFALLDSLTKRYNKLIKPSIVAQAGEKALTLVPDKIKEWGTGITTTISEQELYQQVMELVATGFKTVEETAAKLSISEKTILKKADKIIPDCDITDLSEVCLARSYDISKIVNGYKTQDTFVALAEGGATGAFGFWGLPFNIVLSTFIFFRAVQSIAMFYGYDVKNDGTELIIASEVFTNALSPTSNDTNNEVTGIIGKIMVMTQAAVVKQTAKKTWTDMAARGGIPLLIAQMRALAHKTAQNALEKAGAKGLENSVFREVFEQIGHKLTLKTVSKSIPYVSAVLGALIDTAQMRKVLEYADVFYHKRYILEKETRINSLVGNGDIVIDADIVDE